MAYRMSRQACSVKGKSMAQDRMISLNSSSKTSSHQR